MYHPHRFLFQILGLKNHFPVSYEACTFLQNQLLRRWHLHLVLLIFPCFYSFIYSPFCLFSYASFIKTLLINFFVVLFFLEYHVPPTSLSFSNTWTEKPFSRKL